LFTEEYNDFTVHPFLHAVTGSADLKSCLAIVLFRMLPKTKPVQKAKALSTGLSNFILGIEFPE
jgi:hypothetical protein